MRPPALHFERRGSGPAAILLHGFTGSGLDLAGVAQALSEHHETIVPDLPGHGRSVGAAAGGGAYGFDATLERLAEVLDGSGRTRAHWIGYSMGARLALAFAARFPARVASLVLLAGRAGIADPAEREARRFSDEALAARIERIGVEAFVAEWLSQPMFDTLLRLGPQATTDARRARAGNDARELAAALRGLGPAAQPPVFDDLPRLAMPVLLVAGALDRRFVGIAEDLAGRLPDSQVRLIANAGHAAHLEQPAAFRSAVLEFLRRVDDRAPGFRSHPVQETNP